MFSRMLRWVISLACALILSIFLWCSLILVTAFWCCSSLTNIWNGIYTILGYDLFWEKLVLKERKNCFWILFYFCIDCRSSESCSICLWYNVNRLLQFSDYCSWPLYHFPSKPIGKLLLWRVFLMLIIPVGICLGCHLGVLINCVDSSWSLS